MKLGKAVHSFYDDKERMHSLKKKKVQSGKRKKVNPKEKKAEAETEIKNLQKLSSRDTKVWEGSNLSE